MRVLSFHIKRKTFWLDVVTFRAIKQLKLNQNWLKTFKWMLANGSSISMQLYLMLYSCQTKNHRLSHQANAQNMNALVNQQSDTKTHTHTRTNTQQWMNEESETESRKKLILQNVSAGVDNFRQWNIWIPNAPSIIVFSLYSCYQIRQFPSSNLFG